MELQISYNVCTKVQKKGFLRRTQRGNTRDIANTLPMERRRNNRGGNLSRPRYLLVSIPPKMSISGFMGYLKGKSSLMIFQRFGNMKFAYRNREFWCKGYYVDTTGKNTAAIKSYIENQLKEDKQSDQLSLFDPRDPFTGSK